LTSTQSRARSTGLRQYTDDRLTLLRIWPLLGAALSVVVGVRLAATPSEVGWPRVLGAALVAGAVTACVNTANDVNDIAADAVNKPHRPLPSGRVSPASAIRLACATALLGLALAASLGRGELLAAAALLALGLVYCHRVRSTVVWGNLLVACLAGSPVPFGAYVAAREINRKVVFATAILVSFMAAFEVLKTFRDRAADRAAGYTTLATHRGRRHSLGLFAALVAVTCAVSLLPLTLPVGAPYFLVMGAGVCVPALAVTVFLFRDGGRPAAVLLALRVLGYSWWPGLFAVGWLM
jgi:geranylgeranylglycerol-phosphate geranylgeranyltransferase